MSATCPYCNTEIIIPGRVTSLECPRCRSVCRVMSGKLYRSEEVPPEVSCCFVGLFANIARSRESGHEDDFNDFFKTLEDSAKGEFLRKYQESLKK